MKRRRHEIADRAVRSDLVVVSTPSLAFSARFVEAEEPVHVQTLSAELAVQAFDEGIVRRLTGSAEVERHVVHEGPEVELSADELRPVVEPNRLRIAVAHARLRNLLDPLAERSLPGPLRTVVIGRSVHRHGAASTANAYPPGRPNMINHLTLPGRLHIFRRITSCSISLSSERSATSFFSRWFSSSSCFSRFISDGIRPPYFLRQL